MKNIIRFLGVFIVLLTLVQLISMFMPYFNFSDMISDPESQTEFTIQEYVWIHTGLDPLTHTINLGNYFKKLIPGYVINDCAEPLALTFLIGCVVVFLNMLNFANSYNKLVTFRASLIKILTHLISCAWAGIAVYTYLADPVLTVPQADSQLYMIGLYTVLAAAGLIALRLIVEITVSSVAASKERKARRAARQAA